MTWDKMYHWEQVDENEISLTLWSGVLYTNHNDLNNGLANVIAAYRGTLVRSIVDLPSTVYFYIWHDKFDEKDPESYYRQHTMASGYECRCDSCKHEGGPLFIDSRTGLYDRREAVPAWFEDYKAGHLIRNLVVPGNNQGVRQNFVNLVADAGFERALWEWRNRREVGSMYYSSQVNLNLKGLEKKLQNFTTFNFPPNPLGGIR